MSDDRYDNRPICSECGFYPCSCVVIPHHECPYRTEPCDCDMVDDECGHHCDEATCDGCGFSAGDCQCDDDILDDDA